MSSILSNDLELKKKDRQSYPEDVYIWSHEGMECKAIRRSIVDCFIKRFPSLAPYRKTEFHWCGYAKLPKNHRYYGKDLTDSKLFKVHGGVTFSDGETIGFDCVRHNDTKPGGFKDFDYVKNETNRLAEQVAKCI